MMMIAPDFWQHRRFIAELLLPFSVLYFLLLKLRQCLIRSVQVDATVICVGNITVGGTGKTPVSIAIASFLLKKKKKVAFISKGYGGKLKGPIKVNPKKHTFRDVGDEPLLLSRIAPCWVGKSRLATANAAIKAGAKILILDDGLQDPSIVKDISLLIIDGEYGFGNGFILPAGPLRGPVKPALTSSNAAIIIGEDLHNLTSRCKLSGAVLNAHFTSTKKVNKKKDYVAFAGIGRPKKFFDTLIHNGLNLSLALIYPDHHPYTTSDKDNLLSAAKEYKASLITTEKDWVRLPKPLQKEVISFPVKLVLKNTKALTSLFKDVAT